MPRPGRSLGFLVLLGISTLSAAPAFCQAIPSPGRIIPQIAAGGAWELELQVFNLTDVTQEIEIRFWDDNGASLALPLWEEDVFLGSTSGLTGDISANALRIFRSPSDGVPENLRIGYGGVGSTPDPTAVAAWAVLTQKVADRPDFQLSIPKLAAVEIQRLPYRNAPPFTSSLAVVTTADQVRLVAYAKTGDALCSEVYEPLSHQAFLVEDVLPCTAGADGTVEVRSLGGLPATVVGVTANDFGAFTVQLPVELPSP